MDEVALRKSLRHRPLDCFRRYTADTATFGSGGAILLAMAFFATGNVVLAIDTPFDPEGGQMFARETIRAIDELPVTEQERAGICHGNLVRLVHRSFA